MRIIHQRGCFVSVGGTLSEFTPDAITGTVQLRGTATNVEGPLAGAYDAVLHRWYVNANAALYSDGTQYEVEWSVVRGVSTYGVTEYFDGWQAGGGADLTVIGAATIGVTGVTDTTITLSHVPPATVKYSYTQFKAIPINGGTVVTTTGTGATVTLSGLAAGTKYIIVAIPFSIAGIAGTIGVASVVETETLQAAVPDLPLIVEHYFDGASAPQITEMIDAEGVGDFRLGGGGTAVGNCILYRQRLVCLAPVERLEVRCLSLLVGVRQLNQQVGGVRSPRGYNP